jgi:hypothetical protein
MEMDSSSTLKKFFFFEQTLKNIIMFSGVTAELLSHNKGIHSTN